MWGDGGFSVLLYIWYVFLLVLLVNWEFIISEFMGLCFECGEMLVNLVKCFVILVVFNFSCLFWEFVYLVFVV